jgi:histone acetyltransferase 1
MKSGHKPGGGSSSCKIPLFLSVCSKLIAIASYEKVPPSSHPNTSEYSIVGYSTNYHFLTYKFSSVKPPLQTFTLPFSEPVSPASLPSRARVSQFLILPSHQGHSHGTHLLTTITATILSNPTVLELTVEDPNEAFDDLRDYTDYTRLQTNGTFSQITLTTDLPPTLTTKRIGIRVPTSKLLDVPLLESLRSQNKLAPRQFARLVELHLLSRIPPETRQRGLARLTQRGKATDSADRAYYYWRLLVKQRVYKQNRDILAQLDRTDRIDKVEQTVGELVGDYERLLRRLKDRSAETETSGRKERKKRKIISEEDEVEGEDRSPWAEDADDEALEVRAPKRRREDADVGSRGSPPPVYI